MGSHLKPFTKLTHTHIQRMKPINFVYSSVIGVIIHNILTLHGAPQLSFGGGGTSTTDNTDDSDQKTISDGASQGSGQSQTDNKIFFGNSNNNLNNILLGAAVGAGGGLAGQAIIDGVNNNQCNCNGPNRKRSQIQLQQDDQDQSQVDKDDGDKKIFGLFEGGNSCNCNAPSSVEFGPDCKGRLEGNQCYGCGCANNSAGGLFTFGRRRRRQINTPTSPSSSSSTDEEDVDNRLLNFRCIGALLSGRNQQNQNSQ